MQIVPQIHPWGTCISSSGRLPPEAHSDLYLEVHIFVMLGFWVRNFTPSLKWEKRRGASSYRYQIKQKTNINGIDDLGQKFYNMWNSVPVSAELNKTPVSKMKESHVLGPCRILGLQNQIHAVSWLKQQTSVNLQTLEEETTFYVARFSSGRIY